MNYSRGARKSIKRSGVPTSSYSTSPQRVLFNAHDMWAKEPRVAPTAGQNVTRMGEWGDHQKNWRERDAAFADPFKLQPQAALSRAWSFWARPTRLRSAGTYGSQNWHQDVSTSRFSRGGR